MEFLGSRLLVFIMEIPTVFVPEIRLNKNHISVTFRVPYWLVASLLLIVLVLRCQGKSFDILLVTTISTWVFWLLNRFWPYKVADGGVYVRQWN